MIRFKRHHEVTPVDIIVIILLLMMAGYLGFSLMIDVVDNYICKSCRELFDLVFGKLIKY